VTISLGSAELTPRVANPLDFIGAADGKLYQAKRAGRNCVMG